MRGSTWNELKDSDDFDEDEDTDLQLLLLLVVTTAGRMRATGRSTSECRGLTTSVEPCSIATFYDASVLQSQSALVQLC